MKHGIKRAICLLLAAATMVLLTGCGAGSNGQRRTAAICLPWRTAGATQTSPACLW